MFMQPISWQTTLPTSRRATRIEDLSCHGNQFQMNYTCHHDPTNTLASFNQEQYDYNKADMSIRAVPQPPFPLFIKDGIFVRKMPLGKSGFGTQQFWNRCMRIAVLGLASCSIACSAQATGDTQQQIIEHNRNIQQDLAAKRPDLAIPELKALVTLAPNDADAHGNLGVLLFFRNDCAGAVPELRAATTLQPDLWRIQVLLGTCEQRAGDATQARADLESAFPHLDDKKLRLEAGMKLVDLYINAGDPEKAAPILDALRAENPTNVGVLYSLYQVHTEMAGEAMLSLSMADPNSAEMHEVMGHETMRYGDPAGAIAQYREAIKINPKLPGVHFELAEVLSESLNPADKKEAENEYKLALELNPQDEKAECRLAEIDVVNGNIQEANQRYAKAVQLAPGDVDARLGLARTLIRLDKRDDAMPILKQVLQLEPENDTAHYLLGRLYSQEGQKESAQQELELYKKYKAMRDKLGDIYKQMRATPTEIRETGEDQNIAPQGK
jgi:cytochrome c-type biogenesis protein CcmH/NrfG